VAAILDAALDLVAEVGYDRVTVDAIAGRARVSKATMYRNWSGKSELVADALRRGAHRGAPGLADTGTLRGDLLATVADIARSFTADAGPSLLGLTEAIRQDPVLRDLVRAQVEQRGHEVGRLIVDRALARGEDVDPANHELVVEVAFAQLLTTTLLQGRMPDDLERAQLVDRVLLPLLGAAPPSGPTRPRTA
jgi:AcrR family transcriptional regulator